MPKKKTTSEFIINSLDIHGDIYDYTKVNYTNNKTKVEIICKFHGSFYQTPNDHIGGHGCRKCAEENTVNYNMKESASETNRKLPLDFYIINLFSKEESFIKVGISKEVAKRHKNIKTKSGYNIKPLLIFPCTLEESVIIERNLLINLKKEYKYIPDINFPGYTECLTLSSKEVIIEKLKTLLENKYQRSPLVSKILKEEYN